MRTAEIVRAIHRAGVASEAAEGRALALLWHGVVWAGMQAWLEWRLRGCASAEIVVNHDGGRVRASFADGVARVRRIAAAREAAS